MNKRFHLPFLVLTLGLLAGSPGPLHAESFQVNNLDDNGPGSLRQAINDANALPGPHQIEFQSELAGALTLESPLPALLESMAILGPVSGLVTIDGNDAYQPFLIEENVAASISDLTISNGQSPLGGAIANFGELTLSDIRIINNSAEFGGGGISNEGGLLIHNSTIAFNLVGDSGIGGGVENFGGSILIIDSRISQNSAEFGGAIDNFGQLQILHSTLDNNQGMVGGAIGNTGELLMVNSTISGNSAASGGGIDNFQGQVELLHVTIAGNSATEGGGIKSDIAFTVKNSLIVSSPMGNDCDLDPAFPPSALGSNLDTDGTCTGFQSTTVQALDLKPLIDNGGPTETHALGPASAAVDAANDCTELDGSTHVSEDQRGVARPQSLHCDIGAFELEDDLIFVDAFEL
jgi:hypothetical protein